MSSNHLSLKETHNTADTSLVNVLCIVVEGVWYYQTLLLMTKHDCHCLYFYFYVFIVITNIISTIITSTSIVTVIETITIISASI